METPKYITPEDVAKIFLATRWTVIRWIEAGKLPAARVGRRWLIPIEAVAALGQKVRLPDDEIREIGVTIKSVLPGFVGGDLSNVILGTEKPALEFWRSLAEGIRELQAARLSRGTKKRNR